VALLDATFARAARRAEARAFAAARGVPAFLVEARCGRAVTLRRLARREAAGRDPSDAGPAVYHATAAAFEPPSEWPRARRAVVATDRPWRAAARVLARRLRELAAIRGGGGAADLPGGPARRPRRRRTR
jgi:predicted kinase